MQTETKVGALVIAAAVGFGWLITQSGNGASSVEGPTRVLSSQFSDVDGINKGSKVKVAGLEVGEITKISLNPNGSATLHMIVREDTPLPSNVKARITTSGLIGEKFVALTTDFAPNGVLAADQTAIPSIGSSDPADIAADFSNVSADLQEITSSLRSALGGPENSEKLSRIVNSLDSLTSKLNNGVQDDQIQNILEGLESFSLKLDEQSGDMIADLRDSASTLKKMLTDNEGSASNMFANIGKASENLVRITDQLAEGKSTLGQLMMEESSAFDDLQTAMKDLREITDKINNGEGTIGRLINDPATAEKIDGALDSFSSIAGRLESFRTEVDFHGYSLTNDEIGKGRFNITFRPRPTRYYVVGVTTDGYATEAEDPRSNVSFAGEDFGDDLKFTAQFGHVFESALFNKDVGFRLGLKDSTFGVGTDMSFFDDKLEISADAYDFTGENSGTSDEAMHLDFTARYMLIDRSLYAIGGYDNVFNEKYGSPFIGLGFRFQDDDLKYLVGQAL